MEESGAVVMIDDRNLHMVFSSVFNNQVHITFIGRMTSDGHFESCEESSEVRFFDIKDIPWDQLAFDSVDRALRTYVNDGREEWNPSIYHTTRKPKISRS